MPSGFWEPNSVVVWQEAWRGQVYFAWPVRVVEDDERHLVVYVAEGTRYTLPPGSWPFGEAHPWAGREGWTGHGVLVRHRPGDAHAIWHFWDGEERGFAGWYVNLQAPFQRDGSAFLTQDHELDIWITPDGSWRWKDEQELEEWVGRGRFTSDEVMAIRAEGERVLGEWPFPTGWEEWRPDPAWSVPELPEDWNAAR
jgi:hypothetical protein